MQLDMLKYPNQAGHRGVHTSIKAAEKVNTRLKGVEQTVLKALSDMPMTDEELAHVTGISFGSAQPARSRLLAKGKVKDSGLVRKNARGNASIVWQVV